MFVGALHPDQALNQIGAGVVSDQNGKRDDLQRLEKTFPNYNSAISTYLDKYVKQLSYSLVGKDSFGLNASNSYIFEKIMQGEICLRKSQSDSLEVNNWLAKTKFTTYDTKERLFKYMDLEDASTVNSIQMNEKDKDEICNLFMSN